MTLLSLATLLLALLGGGLFLLGLLRLWRRRLLSGCGHCGAGACLIAAGGLAGAIGLNLHTYERLTHERDVVDIRFVQSGEQQYTAILRHPDRPVVERFTVQGDEWQLDARVLKWSGPAVLLGMDSHYRLERLSGRYHDLSQEASAPRSVYGLAGDQGLDLWAVARENHHWMPWVDAVYGSATYLPMADGAEYRVSITQSGVVTRPNNTTAEDVARQWN